MSDAMEILRDNLTRLMAARGWSQRALAAKSGVSQSAIGYVLRYADRQDKRPGIEKIEMLAKPFGLDAWQLLRPLHAQSAPEPLDAELLRVCIRGAADVYRARGMLMDDATLAAAAAFLYRRVRAGASLRAATDAVKQELSRFGANLAPESNDEDWEKKPRESTGKGTARRGQTGIERDTKRSRSKARG